MESKVERFLFLMDVMDDVLPDVFDGEKDPSQLKRKIELVFANRLQLEHRIAEVVLALEEEK